MTRMKQKSTKQAAIRKSVSTKHRSGQQSRSSANGSRTAAHAISDPGKSRNRARRPTKKAAIGALLRQSDGTTLAAMMKATGWLAHSVRATLTGLRKAGHEIVRSKDGQGASRYRVVAEP